MPSDPTIRAALDAATRQLCCTGGECCKRMSKTLCAAGRFRGEAAVAAFLRSLAETHRKIHDGGPNLDTWFHDMLATAVEAEAKEAP